MTDLKNTVVGDTKEFTVTFKVDGVAVAITGSAITFTAKDGDGITMTRTTEAGEGITILTQSGATVGQATIEIQPDDYPDAWLEITGEHRVAYSIKRVDADGDVKTPIRGFWSLQGQLLAE